MTVAFHHDAEVSECAVALPELLLPEYPFYAGGRIFGFLRQIGQGRFLRNAVEVYLSAVSAFIGIQTVHMIASEQLVEGYLPVYLHVAVVAQNNEDGVLIGPGVLGCPDDVSHHPVGKPHHFKCLSVSDSHAVLVRVHAGGVGEQHIGLECPDYVADARGGEQVLLRLFLESQLIDMGSDDVTEITG